MVRIVLFVLLVITAQAQPIAEPIVYTVSGSKIVDFEARDGVLYLLSKDQQLFSADLKSHNVTELGSGFAAIHKNPYSGLLVAAKSNGEVFRICANGRFRKLGSAGRLVHAVFAVGRNSFAAHTDSSVFYKGKHYVPKRKTEFYGKVLSRNSGTKLIKSDFYFLDRQKNIWFDFDEGEWGGQTFFFNLRKKKFHYNEPLWLPTDTLDHNFGEASQLSHHEYFQQKVALHHDKIKITKEDTLKKFPHELVTSGLKGAVSLKNGDIITASSGMHFFVDSSLQLLKHHGNQFYKFESLNYLLDQDKRTNEYGGRDIFGTRMLEYLGPVAYNPFDKQLYYYTNNGFFRIRYGTKELLFNPSISWDDGLPLAVGYGMNVRKFEFLAKDQFAFLSSNDGVGIYDGKNVIYYK